MMRIKRLIALASAICVASIATAGFEQFNDPVGYMNVFENLGGPGGSQGAYIGGPPTGPWGVPDLRALTSDNRTFELLPNTGTYNAADPYWSDGAGDGNKWMDANTLFERTVDVSDTVVTMDFDVDAFDLNSRYTLIVFVKVLDSLGGSYSTLVAQEQTITAVGSNKTVSIAVGSHPGQLLQAGFSMRGLNANPVDDWGSATITITALGVETGDNTPPDPVNMTFAVAPFGFSDDSVSMTATTATDISGVEYYFSNVSGGGHDSGWQSDPTYVDSGLNPNSSYSYTVIARDLSANQNSNNVSPSASATTKSVDTDPPAPPPEIVSAEPSSITVLLTSSIPSDDSSIEYYFANETTGIDSGWQSSPIYADSGLSPASTYSYTVMARDLSAATNTTAVSGAVMVTTWSSQRSAQLVDSLKGYTGDSNQGAATHDLAVAGWEIASNDVARVIAFDGNGATFGSGPTFMNRNTLRTLYEDYGDYDFEAYATFVTQNTSEQAGFIGVGQGIVGNFGVPDLDLVGVNAIYAEMQGNWCKVFTQTNGLAIADETVGISTFTNRVRMVHDSLAQTITFELDTDYDGVSFVSDRTLGTTTTTNVWVDAPQRIYIAAGAGVLFKDVEISSAAPSIPILLSIDSDVAGQVLQWDGVPGQTYQVQWSDKLINPTWIEDASVGTVQDMGGMMSVTSTVSATEAFYRFIEQ